MSFDVRAAISEAWERLTTVTGAVLVLALGAVSVLRAVARQDLFRALLEEIRDPAVDALREEDPEQAEEVADAIDQTLANLPLALDLSPGAAIALWLVGLLLAAAVVAIAIDAFERKRDRLSGVEVEGLGSKALHVAVGWIAFWIVVLAGLNLLVLPGLVALVVFAYFPVAIVVEDEPFWSAFGSSLDAVRGNVGDTILVLLVAVGAFVATVIVGGAISGALPDVPGAIVDQFVGTVATVFVLALLTQAYLAASTEQTASATADEAEGEIHEDW